MAHRFYKTFYKAALQFANFLTPEQRKGLTPEKYATKEATEQCERLDVLQKKAKKEQIK